MWRRLFGVIAVLTALFLASRSAYTEITWDYVKPSSERDAGEWLFDILGLSEFGRDYAVIVGLSRFEYFNPLDATENDPQRVFEFLRDEAGFDYILVLRDKEITYQALRDLFEFDLPNTLKGNDRFLLFWSGHGTQFPDARGVERGYLPLVSSPLNNKAKMVDMDDLERWDNELPAKQALFLLDACFSGLAGMAAQSDDKDLEIRDLSKPGHHIISAGRSDEQTIASRQEWQGSIFTHALLKALSGRADRYGGKDGGDGVINLHELVADMGETVKYAKAAAGWNRPLRPILNVFPARGEGQFFFLTNEKKRTYLEAQGVRVGDEMAHGMPVVVVGPDERTPAATRNPYGGRDVDVFSVIKDSDIAKDFQDFLKDYPESVFAPYARNRLAMLMERRVAAPARAEAVPPDVAAAEAALNLRPEDRTVVQKALTALGFDTRGADSVFGANTRRAIARWQRNIGENPTSYLTATQYKKLMAEPKRRRAILAAAQQKPHQATPILRPSVFHFPGSGKKGKIGPYCCDDIVTVTTDNGDIAGYVQFEPATRTYLDNAISENFAINLYGSLADPGQARLQFFGTDVRPSESKRAEAGGIRIVATVEEAKSLLFMGRPMYRTTSLSGRVELSSITRR
jgi:peptidoglycan hydrolase-like protein with peptidoglycan-binding domain